MTNQQSTLTANCPSCFMPATQPLIHEKCLRTNNNHSDSFDTLIVACITPESLKDFHCRGMGEDPCIYCPHNQITEIPGSFIKIEQGVTAKSWHELHKCPNCSTIYSVNAQTNAFTAVGNTKSQINTAT